MAGEAYKVIIEGISPGRDPGAVKKNLSALFKSNPAHVEVLLSGKPVVVKKTGDKDAAIKCHQMFCRAGANSKVIRTAATGVSRPAAQGKPGPAGPASSPSAPRKPRQAKPVPPKPVPPKPGPPGQSARPKVAAAGGAPGPVSPKKAAEPEFINPMTCPACGFKQEKTDECFHCGIIIAKYIKKTGKAPPEFLQDLEPEGPEDEGMTPGGVQGIMGDHFGEEIGESYSFWEEAPLAFVYPFKGNGLFILIAGAIFFGVMKVIPFLGLYRFAVLGFIGGYLAAYMFKVVNRSADREDRPPNWPSLVNMGEDLALPFLRMLIPGIFCYIPAILVFFLFSMAPGKVNDYTGEFPEWAQEDVAEGSETDENSPGDRYSRDMPSQNMPPFIMPNGQFNPYGAQNEEEEYEEVDEDSIGYRFWTLIGGLNPLHQGIVLVILVMLGSFYYPMSILTVAMSGSLLALSPHLVIPGIFKTFIPYLFTCFLYLFALVLKLLADRFIVIPIPLTGPILEMFVTIYFLMVEARLLGVLYNANAEKLGWYDI